jgi:lipopolysaccharide biosynthesis glycosyltransferase
MEFHYSGVDQGLNPMFNSVKISVVCACDDKYAMPLAVTIRSALDNLNSDSEIELFVIDGGIKPHNKQKILKSLSGKTCKVKFIPKPISWLKDIEEAYLYGKSEDISNKHISLAAYYRLLIPELLPEQIEKVIYLDCDLLVRGDLYQLWQIDLGDNYLFAVQDMWIPYISSPEGLSNYQELCIPPTSKYFNSGVLVINLKQWRLDKLSLKAIEYLNQNKKFIRHHDQEILNALCVNQWGELDPKWNVQTFIFIFASEHGKESSFSKEPFANLALNPCIVHYTGATKPWTGRHVPLEEYFFHYVDMTAWSGWRLTLLKRFWRRLIREIRKTFSIINLT